MQQKGLETMPKNEIISASLEDYLETIALLSSEHEHGHAHARSIADKLNVKKPSVTNALKLLSNLGHIEYSPNLPVKLTNKGRNIAERILSRHQHLENFLSGVLHLSKKESDAIACKIEHLIDDEFVYRLGVLTEQILHEKDNHNLNKYLKLKFTSSENKKTEV